MLGAVCSRTRVDNEQDEDKGKMEGDEDWRASGRRPDERTKRSEKRRKEEPER